MSRLSTPLRTALVAGLAALVLFGIGAWSFHRYLYDAVYDEADQRALQLSLRLADQAARGWKDGPSGPGEEPFVQIDRDGHVITASGGARYLAGLTSLLPPPPPDPAGHRAVGNPHTHTVRLGEVDERERSRFHLPDGSLRSASGYHVPVEQSAHAEAHALSHKTLFVVSIPVMAPADACEHPTESDGSCRSTLYLLVPTYAADYVSDALTEPLAASVPAAAFVVAATAWAATRRSLRPVDAMRREVAEITDDSLDRRVPVPEGRDPIRALARTTNTTLDRLEDAVERQRRFVGDAAHELRSPLAALHYQLETALDHPGSIDPTEALEGALVATRRIHGLTEDLLLLARPDQPVPRSLVDLAGLSRELVLEYGHLGHPVTLDPAPEQASVRGDGLQLHRLLRNLLDNAVRHARTAVVLTVT
ncbi:MAG: histidine kinase dimerization/phospho-acceptor domain-containing protein, partial [Actinomycetes bacterium]